MEVIVKEVLTKKDMAKWVRFPNDLYKNDKAYVPFLENDEFETFSAEKNPAYEFCETKLFIAYKDKTEKPKYLKWYWFFILPFLHIAVVAIGLILFNIIANIFNL